MEWIKRLKPGVHRIWLHSTAGLIWTCVGLYLISLAMEWIFSPEVASPAIYYLPGIFLAFLIFQFGFSRLAIKNRQRINDIHGDKPCIFGFQAWHSYPLVLVMISLGIFLRKYSPLPKPLLGILYIGIGGGLSGSSVYYYQEILEIINQKITAIRLDK